MVLVGFLVQNKLGKIWFFEETFLLADTSMGVMLKILFLTLSDANVQFREKELEWRSYTTIETLPTIKKVELIDKREFLFVALDENTKRFVIYIANLSAAPTM